MSLTFDPTRITRRTLCASLAGGAVMLNTPALAAQSEEAEAPTPSNGQLFLNLFTRLAVEVQLSGTRDSRFVIDTGAQATSISDRLASEMGFASGPSLTIHAATASTTVPSAVIPTLRVADKVYANVLAPVFPAESLGSEGLLGVNHLAQFRLTLDQRRRRATLGDPTSHEPTIEVVGHVMRALSSARMTPVPTRVQGGLIMLDVQVNSVRTTAFLDTGAQYSVGNLALLSALSSRVENRPFHLHAVSGPPVTVSTGPNVGLSMGQRRLSSVPLLYGDLHIMDYLGLNDRPALMIGADIMGRFEQVRIDYQNSQISLGQTLRPRR